MDLAALEEIRRLKYRYLRCVDLKLWDEIADVFTPDARRTTARRPLGQPLSLAGRDEIVAFLRDKLGPDIITVHFAASRRSMSTATRPPAPGRFEDTVIATEYRVLIKGAAFYEDRYARGDDGRWRISHTGYSRIYETMMSLDDAPSLRFTANIWAARGAEQAAARGRDRPRSLTRF